MGQQVEPVGMECSQGTNEPKVKKKTKEEHEQKKIIQEPKRQYEQLT